LDRESRQADDESGTPSSQMLRYLRHAEDVTRGRLRHGILTNGRIWRLYRHQAGGTAEKFFEIDLGKALEIAGCEDDLLDRPSRHFADTASWRAHVIRLFIAFFGRPAFEPQAASGTFIDLAINQGQFWEAKVAKSLAATVFDSVFPLLARSIAKHDKGRPANLTPGYLDEVRQGALLLLYRLLFVLYAEDRNLLPDESGPYAPVCLTRMRLEIAERRARGEIHAESMVTYWHRLASVFRAIAQGDDTLGIPPYNGGLFDPAGSPILERTQLPDPVMAEVIFGLSHQQVEGEAARYINYRDLSVQQLGSVYERLLEFRLAEEAGAIAVVLSPFGRKSTGSYYTPDELVQLIISRAVGPLVDEAEEAFAKAVKKKAKGRELEACDPASAILALKICDPAMGSGHFLVSLVDWMTDRVLEAMDMAEDSSPGYISPVAVRIADIRRRILEQARQHNWPLVESHLDNRHVVRRMVLKQCVYGVDMNPMAVELAKVALWLHSFTVGAPLSFLDHHLICGNSLFGESVRSAMDEFSRGGLFINATVQRARASAAGMARLEALTDADISEAKSSLTIHQEISAATQPLRDVLSAVHALRWVDADDAISKAALKSLKLGTFGDDIPALVRGDVALPAPTASQRALMARSADGLRPIDKAARKAGLELEALPGILAEARAAMARNRFLHWQAAFPGVWSDWESQEPTGGFDAVIGNPPWDRMKFQEVEWFAERMPDVAMEASAAGRRNRIARLRREGHPIIADYEAAMAQADGALEVARNCGAYPLLSSGDINLYALFVERALALVKPRGIVGFLTPSGIASDKSASAFFNSVSTTGRLGVLFDFENRRGELEPFFPDVDSRFKFCVLVVGGRDRRFKEAQCAFFLRAASDTSDGESVFALTPDDFAKVNPNTGTAPIFRSRRDAEITKAIYSRLPVLVDRRRATPVSVFPVKYTTMFHMTNDAELFRTQAQLEADGAYPVAGGRWRKGPEEYVPLYEGKMVQAYDHRAADIVVNEENLHRPAQPFPATDEQHANPGWLPRPQYYVATSAVPWPAGLAWAFGFKDITASTNVRTMIAAMVPFAGVGNTLPLILPETENIPATQQKQMISKYREIAPLFLGNANSAIFDYVARQKVQSTHLNWYIVEQLPVVPSDHYVCKFGKKSAADIVREDVLALTYTSHDMAPFARDMGYIDRKTGEAKPPFPWDPADRARRRARLDALYFMLYFPSETREELAALRETATYIFSTFPIVEREDIAAHGRYLSRDLCLAWINALAAGDPDAHVTLG
ncbi:MAG TPA: hypothetical protein PLA85_08990, partial [Micropepsaceae bacterium]|nr:hypothetical protein [Micropepsaceae bacterium]